MTRHATRRALTGAAVTLALALLAPACNKEEPTKATITVKKEDGSVVPDAHVKLYASPAYPLGDPNRLNKEAATNSAGQVEFDYSEFYKKGQSGFAVLDILCTYDTLVGEGIIKIEEEKNNAETVVIKPAQ
jgi:hypothetical protein